MKRKLSEFLIITFGTLITAAGIYYFKYPNNFSFGGVSGISIILGELVVQLSPGTINLVINALFLVLGYIFLGKSFGIKTAYCSLLFSLSLKALELWAPLAHPLTDQKLLELIFAVVIPAIGSAILFHTQASTGGTEIVALILRKYTRLNISMALLAVDSIIALSSFAVFGVETGLYSILGLVAKSLVVDAVTDNITRLKKVTIITDRGEAVCDYIHKTLDRGATIWDAEGTFTHEKKTVILSAMTPNQAFTLRRSIKDLDPAAFILIGNTNEVYGRGFVQP